MLFVPYAILFEIAPEVTFTQQFIMYSFFIGTPIILIAVVAYVGFKAFKQDKQATICEFCGRKTSITKDCEFCIEDLD